MSTHATGCPQGKRAMDDCSCSTPPSTTGSAHDGGDCPRCGYTVCQCFPTDSAAPTPPSTGERYWPRTFPGVSNHDGAGPDGADAAPPSAGEPEPWTDFDGWVSMMRKSAEGLRAQGFTTPARVLDKITDGRVAQVYPAAPPSGNTDNDEFDHKKRPIPRDGHGSCRRSVDRLTTELAAARKQLAAVEALCELWVLSDDEIWQRAVFALQAALTAVPDSKGEGS